MTRFKYPTSGIQLGKIESWFKSMPFGRSRMEKVHFSGRTHGNNKNLYIK
jgi:hypothetical protein